MHEWVSTRDDQHAAIEILWEEVKNEPAPDSPYGDVREHPSLPFGEKLERPEPEAISFEDLTEGVADTTGPFTKEEKESIRERLRGTGGPLLPSRNELVEQWESDHDGEEFGNSFSDWADEHGGSSGGSGDQSVKISFVGDKGTTIERTFTQGGNGIEVEHNFFRAGQQQGGLAKDLLRGSFEEYERLDVHEVKVHANIDIGGYAWAKFGFRTDSPPDLDSRIQEAYRTKRITGEEKQMLEDLVTEHDGESDMLWHVADAMNGDKKIGFEILKGSDWNGSIQLSDGDAMDRLNRYLDEPSKPKREPVGSTEDTERANRAILRDSEQAAAARAEQKAMDKARVANPRTVAQIDTQMDALGRAHKGGNIDDDAYDRAINRLQTERNAAQAGGALTKSDIAAAGAALTPKERERAVRIANAMRPEYIKTEPTRSASTKADIAAAKRHLDEIQTSFDQLHGKEGRSADEQRKALARQQRKTSARLAGLLMQSLADDPLPPPAKPTGSREMFYEREDGTRGDVDLWREILDDDDIPPDPVPPPERQDLRGTERSGNYGHRGRPGEVGGSAPGDGGGEGESGQVALRPATAGDAKRIASLRIPPAYRDAVHISDDPEADLQATWTDAKGRTQYRYSAEHSEKAAAEKFARLKDFNKALPQLRERITTDLSDTRLSETERESAAILRLIDKTGFRPGSEGETGADTKAYGATTLKAGHVRIDGDKISFRFPSKSGQVTAKTITDPVLAKVLAERKAHGGYLFPNASDADVRDYLHSRDGDFKVKDFRTWNGTNKALETIAKMPVPKTDTAFKKAQREVAKKVAKHLGNTPAIALKSYIDPAVFSAWKAKKT